ncbi:MAG: M36 family metallopeptidase [Acidobacteriota bacterium]
MKSRLRFRGIPPRPMWRTLAFAIGAALLLDPAAAFGVGKILDVHQGLPDFDSRAGQSVAPSAQAVSIVSTLGAHATWNEFGTPKSLIKYGGYLASVSGTPATAARAWIRANKALFGLSDAGVTSLELVNDSKMARYNGHAVIFRQKFGSLPATQDGMITVGYSAGKILYASSSSAGDQAAPGAATLTATLAWMAAAADAGRPVSLVNISKIRTVNGWTVFDVDGFAQPQRARLVAFPTPTNGVRPAFEVHVIDVKGGAATAYHYFVDAQTAQILFRHNAVQQIAQTSTFQGAYQEAPLAPACGPFHGPYTAPAGTTSIQVFASAAVATNDIVLNLHHPMGTVVATSDTATSPEAINYAPGGGVPAGDYFVQVCPFEPPMVPHTSPYSYAGTITLNDSPTAGVPYPPRWRVFPANPSLTYASDDSFRKTWCWVTQITGVPVPGCDPVHPQKPELNNLAARGPWDYDFRLNVPTFTTKGNAANTAEAWGSPLTPAEPYRPVKNDRIYNYPWTNVWFTSKCFTPFVPGVSHDINPAIVNLFSGHNRMHDWSYFLGFTEANFNAQNNNFGNTQPGPYPAGREFDEEVGNVQAGAVSGGSPTYLGRDNANQITLNDGTPPITNQYLFQPIAGAFYSPCVDGDMDTSVYAHEYTHLISNRMVGGPDSSIGGDQGGAMGESWSDLDAVEYLNEYGFVPTNGENPFSVGAYVTGNKTVGIRNYSLDNNPLNYSDVGYDNGGVEVHSDGEIWNAVNFDVRRDLIAKYNAAFPASNSALQHKCADGLDTPGHCPGNRRWIQIVYDAFLLMQASPSMLDARDAYLAADLMRATGTPNAEYPSNQKELWRSFARRGFGFFASSSSGGSDDPDPIPNFESLPSPDLELEKTVTFHAFAADEGNAPIPTARIYVGKYEKDAVPIADTIAATPLTDTAKFVTGLYEFLVVAPGYGHVRFPRFLTAGGSLTIPVFMATNRASLTKGAVATGTGTDVSNLIDDTESSNWVGGPPATGLEGVIVDLQGGVQSVKKVNVSAMLNPASGGRFTALRGFAIQTCTAGGLVTCLLPTDFTTIFTSHSNAFPGVIPRPAAPDLILRSFTVPTTNATHVRLKVITNQCTATGTGFRGEQDNDPLNATDCVTASTSDNNVRAAELQVFTSTPALPPQDPAVVFAMTAPTAVSRNANVTYNMSYTNAGPAASSNARVTDVLPAGLQFVSASNGGVYNSSTRTVSWALGTVNAGFSGTLTLTAKVIGSVGSTIVNRADYTADATTATPAVAVTTVAP